MVLDDLETRPFESASMPDGHTLAAVNKLA